MKKILTVSLVAMMAVSAARADIASTAYVQGAVGAETTLRENADTAIKNSIGTVSSTNMGTTASTVVTAIKEHSDAISDINDELDTMATSETVQGIETALSTLQGTVSANETDIEKKVSDLTTVVNGKQATLNTNQLAAVNSGVTTTTVSQVTTNKNDIAGIKASAYATSGITSAKVSTYDGYAAQINAKEASANKLKTGDTTTINDSNKDTLYPTIGRVTAEIDQTIAEVNNDVSALSGGLSALQKTVSDNETDIEAKVATKVTANTAITGATKAKITYDSKGLVTGGADLAASDIPTLATSKISGLDTALAAKEVTSNKVTTLSSTSTNTQYPSAKVVYDELGKKQATLSTVQLSAANSGITSAKVSTYDTAATNASAAKGVTDLISAGTTGSDGTYVLTATVSNNTVTGYKWELIDRAY